MTVLECGRIPVQSYTVCYAYTDEGDCKGMYREEVLAKDPAHARVVFKSKFKTSARNRIVIHQVF